MIYGHLTGKHTIGVYPLLPDETCWFLAADFDKATWQEDVTAFLTTCTAINIPAYLERSRSGRGGHVWIFFMRPVSARTARELGCSILTRTLESRHQIGLDSYDRFFPNQDTMPKGGFGNLIALPLQHGPRSLGNTVFSDESFKPYDDQWSFLASVKQMNLDEVEAIVDESRRAGTIMAVRGISLDTDENDTPWSLPPSRKSREKTLTGPFPVRVRIVQGNLIYIEKEGLSPAFLSRLLRLAAFQNPDFYKTQAMRLSTFGKPRVISCAEDFPRHIGLPRGCLDEVLDLLSKHGSQVDLLDERNQGDRIELVFRGELRPEQRRSAETLMSYDIGVLCAATAFGKTVVSAWLIAQRKVNTLILVHRRQLMTQWRERLAAFLDLPIQSIGQIGGGKAKRTGVIDIALLQSLNRKGDVKDLVAEYGQVIVDECHHVSAFRFEEVLRQVKARYVIGLTATPFRKDGHHPIIMMQCGSIRFRGDDKEQARLFAHIVIPRQTEFDAPSESSIQDLYASLALDERRNDLILGDIIAALQLHYSPLLLTERVEHLRYFEDKLKAECRNVIVMHGRLGARERREVNERLAAIPTEEGRILLATGRFIGEGFDDARLDTLFLAMPISWRGTLQQYAGRLHRVHDGKRVVRIYDYIGVRVPVLMRMYRKRLAGYRAMGYAVQETNEKGLPLVLADL